MMKIAIILFMIILNIGFYSCTPESLMLDAQEQLCCGEDGDIPPPPPPPPPGGSN